MNRIKTTITVVIMVVLGMFFIAYFDPGNILMNNNDNSTNDDVAELHCQPTSNPGTIVEYSELDEDQKQVVRESIEGDTSPGINTSQKSYFNPQKYIRYNNETYNCQVVQW